ncbi:NRDE family protein [Hydrogenophaga crocea]|uniref:NRDE family protein n=1 Tax=Hydrogenophaga crocea TaxID=2716225 RepID=A0A6G8IFL3_9BURK|nr:NRDE family protein [Hydrogenophaga crocea]QIM52004.1 NRDE family protein [Hydrogenophaga crocea]
MCLIAFAIDAAADCPLLVAANRDEHFARPTAPLQRWRLEGGADVVAGRDLREGGTWMGLTPGGRVAWLTNVRQPGLERGDRSRGELVSRWLDSRADAEGFADGLEAERYGGFNLVVGDLRRGRWHWLSNRDPAQPHAPPSETQAVRLHLAPLSAGVHTLSNATLDTPWPKARRLAEALRQALAEPHAAEPVLADALTDTRHADDAELPQSGVPLAIERALSSPFVRMPERRYGTRSSTLLRWHSSGVLQVDEWTHGPGSDRPVLAADRHRREAFTVA